MTAHRTTSADAPTRMAGAIQATGEREALELGVEAYVYGYPLVLMDVTRAVTTTTPRPEGAKAPVNQFVHLRKFPDHTFTDVVSPNADTLYSSVWLDLKEEPQLLSVPDVGKRYYLMPMLDAWTNVFASPGARTTGTGKSDFAIVGPQWTGTLPEGVHVINAPTNTVWLIGRTQTNGASDYAAVRAIQDQYKLTPLSAWGKPYSPPADAPVAAGVDAKTPPVERVAAMDAATFFGRLNALMKDNPPAAADAPALARFAKIGVAPGKPFDPRSMDPNVARGVERSVEAGQLEIIGEAKKPHGQQINGWDISPANTANFGTDYSFRAVVALGGLGANLQADAIYPRASVDGDGQPLHGKHRYTIRFPRGQLPPVNAFWSLTMYNAQQAFIRNPLSRHAIGDRDRLATNPDGSTTLYLHKDSPGADKESNWLPAPPDAFNVILRLYWPKKDIVEGLWRPPPIERIR
jgi:hypothetical protein